MDEVKTLTPAQRFAKSMLDYHRESAEVAEHWKMSLANPVRHHIRDVHLCIANVFRDFGFVENARKQNIRTVRYRIERMAMKAGNFTDDGMDASELALISYEIYWAAIMAIDAYLDR